MKTKNSISVVVPMYNASKYIERCLASISGQTVKDIEVILVDDNSGDDTLRKAEKYRYDVIRLDSRLSPGAVRNRGAEKASGDIIVFVDSDIVLEPDSIEKISACLKKDDADVVSGTYATDMPQKDLFSQLQNLMAIYRQSGLPELVTFTNSAFCAIKRNAFDGVGGYNEEMSYYEDVEIGHRLAEKGYKCRSNPDLKVTHLKEFSHRGLLADYFKKASTAAAYMIKKRFKKMGSEELSPALRMAGMSSALMFFSVPFIGISLIPFFLFFLLFSVSMTGLLRFLIDKRGVLFGLKAYLVCYEICLISFFAMIYGGLAGAIYDGNA